MRHPYLINYNDPADYLSVSQLINPETGEKDEDQHVIFMGEGPHMEFECIQDIMYGTAPYHEHVIGWETFFIVKGRCDFTVRGKTCHLKSGDMIQIQPYIGHQMSFPEPTIYRGFFHDLNMNGSVQTLWDVRTHNPALLDPKVSIRYLMRKDNLVRQKPVSVEVPVTEVPEARTLDRPLATYSFEGVTLKQYTGRWENGGITEMWMAEMDKGFYADFEEVNPKVDLFYVTEGSIKFKVWNEEFTATKDNLVKIPAYASRSFEVLEKAVMFDVGGKTHWLDLIEDYTSLKTYTPEMLDDKGFMKKLKQENEYYIKSFGLKK